MRKVCAGTLALALVGSPAVAFAAGISAEIAVDAPVAGGPSTTTERTPVSASDGTDHFVVWLSGGATCSSSAPCDLYGVRMSAAGAVLGVPVRIGEGVKETSPKIAFDGTNYLVAWVRERGGIYAARVSRTGALLDATPLQLSTTSVAPSVACTMSDCLVVWDVARPGLPITFEIHGTRLSHAGAVIAPADRTIAAGVSLALAASQTGYLLGHSPTGDSPWNLTRLDATGTVMGSSVTGLPRGAIASNGTDFAAAWYQPAGSAIPQGTYGARINAAGALVDMAGVMLDATNTAPIRFGAFAAGRYQFASNTGAVVGLTPAGVAVPRVSTSAFGSTAPTGFSASATASYVFAASSATGMSLDVCAARLPATPAEPAPTMLTLTTGANSQTSPRIAFDGTNYLVVWIDTRNGSAGANVYGVRVSTDGRVLDSRALRISNTATDANVGYDGTQFVVFWSNNDSATSRFRVFATRVRSDGTVVDATGSMIYTGAQYLSVRDIAVACDGHACLGAWTMGGASSAGPSHTVEGRVLDPALMGPSFTLASDRGVGAISAAWVGSQYVLSWECSTGSIFGGSYAAHVSAAGIASGMTATVSDAPRRLNAPVVAGAGSDYFIAGLSNEATMSNPASNFVSVRRFNAMGVPQEAAPLAVSTGNQPGTPVLAYDGTNYVMVWVDSRSPGMWGTRVSPTRTEIDSPSFAIGSSTGVQRYALHAGPAGQTLLAYQRREVGNLDRVYLRWICPEATTGTCTMSTPDVDGGTPDASVPDVVSTPDVVPPPDVVAMPDAVETPDAVSAPDAMEIPDASSTPDSAPMDVAVVDTATDAPVSDAPTADAGGSEPPGMSGGCSVAGPGTADASRAAPWLLLGALGLVRSRRRRRA